MVIFYSTLSPQKCTKLNTGKQNAQGHLGSNQTPERENRNFRKPVITNSTKPLFRTKGHLSWQSHEVLYHCKIHKKSWKKNEVWCQIWPRVAVWVLIQNSISQTLTCSSLLSPPFHNTTVCCTPVSPLHPTSLCYTIMLKNFSLRQNFS